MKKVISTLAFLSLFLFLTGCSSQDKKAQELESKVSALENENAELKKQVGISITSDSDDESSVSKTGARSNPVPIGKELTFSPLYHNTEVELTAIVTDIKRGNLAEQELEQYNKIKLDTAKWNIGELKENTEFMTYTLIIKSKGIDKDEGIRFPGITKSLSVDGEDLGYSFAIDKLDEYSNSGQVYVDKEYKYRMYGQIEKGKEGLVSFTDLNSKTFFKVN